jgi:hypothetical protein
MSLCIHWHADSLELAQQAGTSRCFFARSLANGQLAPYLTANFIFGRIFDHGRAGHSITCHSPSFGPVSGPPRGLPHCIGLRACGSTFAHLGPNLEVVLLIPLHKRGTAALLSQAAFRMYYVNRVLRPTPSRPA